MVPPPGVPQFFGLTVSIASPPDMTPESIGTFSAGTFVNLSAGQRLDVTYMPNGDCNPPPLYSGLVLYKVCQGTDPSRRF